MNTCLNLILKYICTTVAGWIFFPGSFGRGLPVLVGERSAVPGSVSRSWRILFPVEEFVVVASRGNSTLQHCAMRLWYKEFIRDDDAVPEFCFRRPVDGHVRNGPTAISCYPGGFLPLSRLSRTVHCDAARSPDDTPRACVITRARMTRGVANFLREQIFF